MLRATALCIFDAVALGISRGSLAVWEIIGIFVEIFKKACRENLSDTQ